MNGRCNNCGAMQIGGGASCGVCGGKILPAAGAAPVVDGADLAAQLARAFQRRSAEIVPRRLREAFHHVAADQLEVIRDVATSAPAREIGRQMNEIDAAAGGPVAKGLQALRQILRQRRG